MKDEEVNKTAELKRENEAAQNENLRWNHLAIE